ncbi:hypothetical protein COLO4_38539 [Corchorus olitorius]|uniref:C3H1-type domain-containing protein n=1 Tax=Corchorus olitorius TaxID=93759 RepID=A0A1R3FUC9_9ROSI|nr:hypothetical protein COLO4_38539 [Corchorus olitorius]
MEVNGKGRNFANTELCSTSAKGCRPRNSNASSPNSPGVSLCKYWMSGRCSRGDSCRLLGSDKLYSGSSDATARLWDCITGKCDYSSNLGDEVWSMITEGHWVFIGMKDFIKALNIQTSNEINLEGPVGQVYAMAVANDKLFAGTQNGDIMAWRASFEANPFHLAASLQGHTRAVLCLSVGENMLFSGSADNTIRVWDTETLQCIKTLNGHADAVTSVIHLIHTHKEETGVLTLCGMNDAEMKPVLCCSCNDNTVRLYDLPSFTERGRLFSKREVRVIARGPSGLLFTGDAAGSLSVWMWVQKPQEEAS